MGTLLLLGFVLSLDSFRASLALGALRLSRASRVQIVLAFGLCDAFAPLVGVLIGQSVVRYVGPWTDRLGPVILGAYGVYVVYVARRSAGKETQEQAGWMVLGVPLTLSLDNLIAGTSLGLIGLPLRLSVVVIGVMSASMSLAGLLLGRTAVNYLGVKSEIFGGVALVLIALVLAIENF